MSKSVNLMRLPIDTVVDLWRNAVEDFGRSTAREIDVLLATRKDALGPLVVRFFARGIDKQWASIQIQQPWGDFEHWVLTYHRDGDAYFPEALEQFSTPTQCRDEVLIRSRSKGRFEKRLTDENDYAEEIARNALEFTAPNVVQFRRH